MASAITMAWHVGYCGSGDNKVERERERERERGNGEERNWDFELFRSNGFAKG